MGAAVDEVEVVSSVVVGSEAVGATVVGRPLHLPHLVDLPALQRLPRQVEELAHLAGGALIGEQIHIQRKVDQHRQTTGQVIHLPGSTVGEDDPLHTFIDRIHLYLTQMLGGQLGGDPLHLDEGDQFTVEAHAVVCELPLDLVLGGQVGVLLFHVAPARPKEANGADSVLDRHTSDVEASLV